MSAQDFLVELGTEELPPKALKNLGKAFLEGVSKGLKEAGLAYSSARFYAAPRRLAVLVEQLETHQADRDTVMDGPPVNMAYDEQGQPTQAALGFARKCGVELSEIDKSGPKLRYVQQVKGQPATELLPSIVNNALMGLPVPKRMRWGARREEFVRPTQWLVMLLGNDIVDCEILTQKAGRTSRGHRFHYNYDVEITAPKDYARILKAAHVIVDFDERRALIAQGVERLAKEQNGTAIAPASLLEEVTALVEWPVPLVCSFEERFLAVPQEALIITMQDNQKYFCLLDEHGKLLPRFITVANIESTDPTQIILGNEKVVRPRLTDAEFFFLQDQKQPLDSFNERLKNVVFQAQLGTVYDKAERVSKLAAFIAEKIGSDTQQAARAGLLSKCDLATEMVSEFPEMQGVAGYYYAKAANEPGDVAVALNEQYMPRGAGAELPSTATGAAVAIADKLDTLVGIFGIGMLPTGSKDPYALRRAALGVLRILMEKNYELDLHLAVACAVSLYGDKVKAEGLAEQVHEFIYDRLRARYEDEGVDISVYQAVRALSPKSPLDFDQRVKAVQAFRQLPEAAALAAANKRVTNLLGKSDSDANHLKIEARYFDNPAEFRLNSAIQQAEQATQPLREAHDYTAVLERLASLKEPVDNFFDAVLVNVEEPDVRANRHALLAHLRALFLAVADISLLD
ncbi:glycine--tRNA ligase subunit beta [Pseudomonas sp. F1_0610]|uniref:glycine--tRNA ligase subunit beta n=1 Tax=Pseudomonas sp. F1_0610 TaxID=3114284 RepID=UPI0039C0DE60